MHCWRKLLRVPWTARKSNQSILKEINPEYSLEGLMLELKLQCFGHMIRRTNSLEKTLMLEKIEGRRRRGWQRLRRLGSITDSMDMNLSKLQETMTDREPGVLQSIGSQRVGHDLVTEQQQISEELSRAELLRRNYKWGTHVYLWRIHFDIWQI